VCGRKGAWWERASATRGRARVALGRQVDVVHERVLGRVGRGAGAREQAACSAHSGLLTGVGLAW
jgi:hypothetical protein